MSHKIIPNYMEYTRSNIQFLPFPVGQGSIPPSCKDSSSLMVGCSSDLSRAVSLKESMYHMSLCVHVCMSVCGCVHVCMSVCVLGCSFGEVVSSCIPLLACLEKVRQAGCVLPGGLASRALTGPEGVCRLRPEMKCQAWWYNAYC